MYGSGARKAAPLPQMIQEASSPKHEMSSKPGLTIALGAIVVGVSVMMIHLNKYIVQEQTFPHVLALVMLHEAFIPTAAFILLLMWPAMFPSLTDPSKRTLVDPSFLVKNVLPVAAFSAAGLLLNNSAYLYSTVAFLQIAKEANVVLVYLFSICLGMEKFRWANAVVITLIALATMMSVRGELHFSLMGAIIQGTANVCDSAKMVLQMRLMTSSASKLDPLTMVLLTTPMCCGFLGSTLFMATWGNAHQLMMPSFAEVARCWPLLLLSMLTAFVLTVACAMFMKHSSAMAYVLMGPVKDLVIVLGGTVVLGEVLGSMQAVGFACQLALILLWSSMRIMPQAGGRAHVLTRLVPEVQSYDLLLGAKWKRNIPKKNVDAHFTQLSLCRL